MGHGGVGGVKERWVGEREVEGGRDGGEGGGEQEDQEGE